MFKIGAFGIVLNNKKEVLLCHRRDYDFWNLPGGGTEDLESPWQTVIREVKEETGLNVKIVKLIAVYNKLEKNELVFLFECRMLNGKITINDEAEEIKYFDYKNMPNNIFPNHIQRIKDFFNKEDNVILKTQKTFIME
jgi:ADP-ribose pyrophosphatase YjhB (NUDIX family)